MSQPSLSAASGGRRQLFRLPGQAAPETPPGLELLGRLRALRLLIPALLGGFAAGVAAGDIGDGLLAGIAIYVAADVFARVPLAVHLMPIPVLFVAFAAPLGACAVLALADVLGSGDGAELLEDFVVPVGTAAIAGLMMDLLLRRSMAARPVRLAIVGSSSFRAGLTRELEERGQSFIEQVDWPELGSPPAGAEESEYAAGLVAAAERRHVDLLVSSPEAAAPAVAAAEGEPQLKRAIGQACLGRRIRLVDGNQFYEEVFGHVPLGKINEAWYLHLVHPDFRPPPPFYRRLFDLVAAIPIAILVAPIIAVAALAIKLGDRGPVFYRQLRVGAEGEHFEILKLRSMRLDAERGGVQFSRGGDPRVTPIGRVLRRTHVDELPQILNVLRGEMRLVGPRPERPEIVAEMEQLLTHYSRRELVKPGVTGWAQVRCGYAGSTLGTAWKLCHDLYYLKHRTLLGDLLIMVETLAIAAKDAHRPLRVPESQFVFGRELGLDPSVDEAGGAPEVDQVLVGAGQDEG